MDGLTKFIELIIQRTNSPSTKIPWETLENAYVQSKTPTIRVSGSGFQNLIEQEQQQIWNSLDKEQTKAGFIFALSQFKEQLSFLNKLKIDASNADLLKYQKLFKFDASKTLQKDRTQECIYLKEKYQNFPLDFAVISNIESSVLTLYWSPDFIKFNDLASIQYTFSVYNQCKKNIVTVKSAPTEQVQSLETCLKQLTTDTTVALEGATNFYAYNQSFESMQQNRKIVEEEFVQQKMDNELANFKNDTILRKEIQDGAKYNGFLIKQNEFWNEKYLLKQLKKSISKFSKPLQKAGLLIMLEHAQNGNSQYTYAFRNYFNASEINDISSVDSDKLKKFLETIPPENYTPSEKEVAAEIKWFVQFLDNDDLKETAKNLAINQKDPVRQEAAKKIPYLAVSLSILRSVLKKEKEEGDEKKEESAQDSNLSNQIAAWEKLDKNQKSAGFIVTLARRHNSQKAGAYEDVNNLLDSLQIPNPIKFEDLKKYQKVFKYQIKDVTLADTKIELNYVQEKYPEKETDLKGIHDDLQKLKVSYSTDYKDFASVKYVLNQYEQCVIQNKVPNETLKSMTADEEVKVIDCLSSVMQIPNQTFTAKGDLHYYLLKKQCYDFDTNKYDEGKMMQFVKKELRVRKMDKTLTDLENHLIRRVNVGKIAELTNFLVCDDEFWTFHRERELKYALQEYLNGNENPGLLHIIAGIYNTQNPQHENMKIALENYVERQNIFEASRATVSLMLTNHNSNKPQTLSQQQIELEIDTLLQFTSVLAQKEVLEQIKKYDVTAVKNFKYLESSKFILTHKVFSKIKFNKMETKNTEDTNSTLEVFINIAKLITLYNKTPKNIAQDQPNRQFVFNQQNALKRLLQLYANANKLDGIKYITQFEEVNKLQFNAQNQNVLINQINAMKLINVLDYGTLLDPDFSDICAKLTVILEKILSTIDQKDCKNIEELIKNRKDVQKLVLGLWTVELYPKFNNCIQNYISHVVIANTCPDTEELLNCYEIF